MNLDKELSEFYGAFQKGNVLTRALIILGFFFSLSSLTSLSSTIVKWKGFILEGLNFYQSFLIKPILDIANIIGFGYTNLEVHVAMVSSICIAAGMRVQVMGHKVAYRKINEKYESNLKPNLTPYWVIGITFPIGIWGWYGISDPVIHTWWVIFVSIFLPIFMTFPKVVMSKFGYEYFEKNDFSYFKSYYIYIAALLLIICVLAAINLGLNSSEAPNKSIQPTANASAD